MDRIKVSHLDIPIIRSCNLDCAGCMTHSNHKNIKGIVSLDESIEWLEFWSKKVNPAFATLFGGEPLLHPDFVNWALTVKRLWGEESRLIVNTNGYYIDKLFPYIDTLFTEEVGLSLIVSIQQGSEPHYSTIKNNIENLKSRIIDFYTARGDNAQWNLWLDETETGQKKWFELTVNGREHVLLLAVCDQWKLSWCTHYVGHAETMRPVYQYNDVHYHTNQPVCQARKFVTLYKGEMYKCPPLGVLGHTLETFNLTQVPEWKPYLTEYKKLDITATDAEIQSWFETQSKPEKVCNMCGFSGPKGQNNIARSHQLKNNWKVKILNS